MWKAGDTAGISQPSMHNGAGHGSQIEPKVNGAETQPSEGHNSQVSNTSPSKRKMDDSSAIDGDQRDSKRQRGIAPIKAEYLITHNGDNDEVQPRPARDEANDDAAEAFHHKDRQPSSNNAKSKRREKNQGQNKSRKFGQSRDEVGLCSTRTRCNEFEPKPCPFGEKCKFEHDLRRYLNEHKRPDMTTFDGLCPIFDVKGKCPVGWKCRFVGSHSKKVTREDGRQELMLTEDEDRIARYEHSEVNEEGETGVANAIATSDRIRLTKKNFLTPKTDQYLRWLDSLIENPNDQVRKKQETFNKETNGSLRNSSSPEPAPGEETPAKTAREENRATYMPTPLLPSEKRRLYFGPETPVLAPLTTQGNLPFRRLCTSLGATFTYSEMAMSMPLLQGQKSEWALLKAHESETQAPTFTLKNTQPNIVYDYNQSTDLHFGAQIAANKPWLACKTTEVLTTLLPRGLRLIDLNVGCPIDLVYREGAGSALMDSPHKLEKMLRGMNCVSGSTPITVKIRTGTKDKQPTAQKLIDRLVLGSEHHRGSPCGIAAITLHGRSRQQRYTRSADWDYISSTSSLINNLNAKAASLDSTIHAPDDRDLPNPHKGSASSRPPKVFFLGNGDVLSHTHYQRHLAETQVDAVMIARGALIKPWIFREIESNQSLDPSSSERLSYIESFVRYGLEAWGSDEHGVGTTRRFLLEWLSFACRYVPTGLLEVLPAEIQDRPPRFKGRDELETLMASDNYQDWIKIRYVIPSYAVGGELVVLISVI